MQLIYKITNTKNNFVYIGQTSRSLNERFSAHKTSHIKKNDKFHNAMREIGVDNFKIELLDSTEDLEKANLLESFYINKYDSIKNGYNSVNTGYKNGGDTLSNHPNLLEINKKVSISKRGKLNPNAKKIKAINVITNEIYSFNCLEDCVKKFNFNGHQGISKRLNGISKSPYLGKWLFEYI